MTTITFEENIKINKFKFKNISDFKNYLEKNFYFTKLEKLDKSEITPEISKKAKETGNLKGSDFINL